MARLTLWDSSMSPRVSSQGMAHRLTTQLERNQNLAELKRVTSRC